MIKKKCEYCLRVHTYNKKEIVTIYDTFQYDGYVNPGFINSKPPLYERTDKVVAFECKECRKLNQITLEYGTPYEIERKHCLNSLFKVLDRIGITTNGKKEGIE
jgi:hypothetical protein